MRLVLPDIPRSPNGNKGLLRMHWAARSKYNGYWKDLVRSQIIPTRKAPVGRQLVCISQMRKRKLDRDNLWASVKPLVDALVHWKLISDDDEDSIELRCSQVVGKEKITVVEIEAIS